MRELTQKELVRIDGGIFPHLVLVTTSKLISKAVSTVLFSQNPERIWSDLLQHGLITITGTLTNFVFKKLLATKLVRDRN